MRSNRVLILILAIVAIVIIDKSIRIYQKNNATKKAINDLISSEKIDAVWRGANKSQIPFETDFGQQIWYGYQLISNTSYYLSPKGFISGGTSMMKLAFLNKAAFVNSKPRPHIDQQNDWKNISIKPFDHPFGPYLDTFTETQHKYGPFKEIIAFKK